VVPDEACEVVGEVGHADLGPGPRYSDGTHEHAHAGFLLREDMLDAGADPGASTVGARRRLAYRPALRLLLMNVGDVTVLLQPLFILL